MKKTHLFGYCFLILQLLLIVYARFIPERFFCWAPYDEQTTYRIDVFIKGEELDRDKCHERYHYRTEGVESRTIENVFAMIKAYESTYGIKDNAEVVVTYSTNGHPEKTWHWKN